MSWPPPGFRELGETRSAFGRIRFAEREEPAVFWARAGGFVHPRLVREDLALAEAFGRSQRGGWSYVVDTTDVRAVHPLNPVWLRRIPSLSNIRRYVVVAPSAFVRLGIRSAAWLVKPDAVVRTETEALSLCGLG